MSRAVAAAAGVTWRTAALNMPIAHIANRRPGILQLLGQRERGGAGEARDAGGALPARFDAWAEQQFLEHCSAQYSSLNSHFPKSTIAAAFSPDGQLVASAQ